MITLKKINWIQLLAKKRFLTVLVVWMFIIFALLIYLLVNNHASADLFPPPTTSEVPPIPDLDLWFSNWQNFGQKYYCSKDQIEANGIIETGANTYSAWYYDGMWGAYKLSDRVSSPTEKANWALCATYFRVPYRDNYVLKYNGAIPGWRIFPRGLYEDYLRTGDEKSKEALILMAKNAAYAYRNVAPTASVWNAAYSREVAYNIDSYLLAKKLAPSDPAFQKDDPYIDVALSHLDQWTAWLSNSPRTTTCDCGSDGMQPFMVGLTIKSLYYLYLEIANSPRAVDQAIVTKIKDKVPRILDLMWEEAWGENHPEESGGAQAFYYGSNTRNYQGKEDLNLLIAPAYAFAWRLTGEDRFQIRADKIFSAGVRKADLSYMGKIFSQNYFFSDQYVDLRTISVPPTSTPTPPSATATPSNPSSTSPVPPSPSVSAPTLTPEPISTNSPSPQTSVSPVPPFSSISTPTLTPEPISTNSPSPQTSVSPVPPSPSASTPTLTPQPVSTNSPSPTQRPSPRGRQRRPKSPQTSTSSPALKISEGNFPALPIPPNLFPTATPSSSLLGVKPTSTPTVNATPKTIIEFANSPKSNILSEDSWQPIVSDGENPPEYTSSPTTEGVKLNKRITLAGKTIRLEKKLIYLEITNPNEVAVKAQVKLAIGIPLKNNKIKLYWNKVKPQTETFLPYKAQIVEFQVPSSPQTINAIAIETKKPLLERLKELFTKKNAPLILNKVSYSESEK